MTNTKTVEKEKIIAEKLNGRFAMMGFIALIGAYLTTGQIIPGFVYCLRQELTLGLTLYFFLLCQS